MGCYATTRMEVHQRAVHRCGIKHGLPTPRLSEDGRSYEMNAGEVRAWADYCRGSNSETIDGPTYLACAVMERIASDYISHKADEAPTTQPERVVFLRKATEEFRLFFM